MFCFVNFLDLMLEAEQTPDEFNFVASNRGEVFVLLMTS